MKTPPDLEPVRRAILAAALRRVPFEGWSMGCLRGAAEDAGHDPAMARRAFPRGIADLLAFFMAEGDRHMNEALAETDLSAMRIRDRIAHCVRARLEYHADHRDAARRALALQATPQHAPAALAALCRTTDAMWRAAGDSATDFNYYTKRGLLAGVYGATLLYWLNDKSEDSAATWAFLDRRIADVMRIQKFRGRLDKRFAGFEPALGHLLRRFAVRS